MGNFSTPVSPTDDRSSRQKLNRKMLELNDIINQTDPTDNYRTFHPNTNEYTFFPALRRTFSKNDPILGPKTSLKRSKKIEIIPYSS